ncbi:MAG: hypothetical protein K2Q01_11045, partial [Rickettsiales bacterium]|nr:hypothetical protein [Rickettsiales bacterium]
ITYLPDMQLFKGISYLLSCTRGQDAPVPYGHNGFNRVNMCAKNGLLAAVTHHHATAFAAFGGCIIEMRPFIATLFGAGTGEKKEDEAVANFHRAYFYNVGAAYPHGHAAPGKLLLQ